MTDLGLSDFWTIYDRDYDAIQVATRRLADAHPEFGPIVRQMNPAQLAAQNERSRELLRGAIAGDWAAYDAELRVQGATYAKMGLSFAGWYDLVKAFHAEVVPRLVDAYGSDHKRLVGALQASQAFVDRVMSIIAGAYLTTKEALVVEAEVRNAAERKRFDDLELQHRRIQEASRLKSEFLANMSHELRTPLNAIIGFGELLYDGVVEPSSREYKEFLSDILNSGRHLLQLINDILDLAKVEAGKLDFHPETIALEPVVGEVVAVLRAGAANKDIAIEVAIAPSFDSVFIDPSRFRQVLYNLLSNAFKFTLAGGKVTVRLAPDGDAAFCLEVEDTGAGIAPEDMHRLFVEFEQLEGGGAKKHGGTGLGLALTRRLVEAQGGSVSARSTLGKGSVFRVVLPLRAIGTPLPEPRCVPGGRHDAPRILVVEDDPRDQRLLLQALSNEGYALETAATGAQAIARCRQTRFDAVTLDLLLPDMSGLDVLAEIRKAGASAAAPVIVVSVLADQDLIGGFRVDEVLAKPVDEDALRASLRRAGVVPSGSDHVLVVDDDPASLRLIQQSLSGLGYTVRCASDGQDGLLAVDRALPSAVVLDLEMPKVNGFEFLVRFRARKDTSRVPVIIWTVKDLSAGERRELGASAQAIVRKGIDSTASLVRALAQQIEGGGARAR